MGKFKNEKGKTYGELVVLKRAKNINTSAAWLCLCACGDKKTIRGTSLRSGNTTSCGCKLKLTEQDVITIRTRHAYGALQALLAKEYKVNRSTISLLCLGKTWAHLPLVPMQIPNRRGERVNTAKLTEEDVRRIRDFLNPSW